MIPCLDCHQAAFCSESCRQMSVSSPWMHGPTICRAYRGLQGRELSLEDQSTLRFLVHALTLRETHSQDSTSKYEQLLTLCGSPTPLEAHTISRLTPILADILGARNHAALGSSEELATLVRKEQLNSYGLLASVLPEEDEARKKGSNGRILRGSGVYALASMINHECIPNVARFDPGFPNAATPGVHAARLSFRAMHDLPAGSEITQSYCPLDWTFEERQGQCREVYGFACNCPRCQLEATEGAEAMDEDGGDGASASRMQEDDIWGGQGPYSQLPPNPDEAPLEEGYLDVFLFKFLCPQTFPNGVACSGTMAPTAPSDSPESSVLECNVCGSKRTEAEFLRELEENSQR